MCHHLQPLENYLKEKRVPETFRGKAWSQTCGEWIYFDCILKTEKLKAKLHLPSFVVTHENLDNKSGTELGLVCNICEDGIMGEHPSNPSTSKKILVD